MARGTDLLEPLTEFLSEHGCQFGGLRDQAPWTGLAADGVAIAR